MMEYRKFEAEGRFGLSITHNSCDFSDDFGNGNGESIVMFFTHDSREYFIRAEQMKERLAVEAQKYEHLVAALRDAVKRRSVRKRILELIK